LFIAVLLWHQPAAYEGSITLTGIFSSLLYGIPNAYSPGNGMEPIKPESSNCFNGHISTAGRKIQRFIDFRFLNEGKRECG
jgi:hypothetical protein